MKKNTEQSSRPSDHRRGDRHHHRSGLCGPVDRRHRRGRHDHAGGTDAENLLGSLINFCVPLIIIGFIAPSITRLRSNASRMLVLALALAYTSLSMRRTDVNGGRLRHHPRPVHPVGGGGAEGGAGAAVQPGHRARHVGDVRAGLFCAGGPGGHLDPGQGHHPGAGGVPAGGAGGGLSGGDPHPALLYRGHLLRAGL